MIKLAKSEAPAVLVENGPAWIAALKRHIEMGTEPTETERSRYRHPDIKRALVSETSGKCAYCESKLRHVTYGDVEHIVPKSREPLKSFDWTNLTLACDVCNTNKGGHFGNHEDLVDPYVNEPEEHLQFLGASVLSKPGNAPGFATERILKLNRIDLLERRAEHLRRLNDLLQLLVTISDPNRRAILRRDIEENELSSTNEYAGMARAYVRTEMPKIDAMIAGSS